MTAHTIIYSTHSQRHHTVNNITHSQLQHSLYIVFNPWIASKLNLTSKCDKHYVHECVNISGVVFLTYWPWIWCIPCPVMHASYGLMIYQFTSILQFTNTLTFTWRQDRYLIPCKHKINAKLLGSKVFFLSVSNFISITVTQFIKDTFLFSSCSE